ncbi:hypothetical protein NEUTE2DRAFT_131508 [Neurospora tetrasperma FGSC 2509]|nr:hypothetical protein NEUTE2DRAFT_131508 [Neurospora tetrasperma FGSC 2509]
MKDTRQRDQRPRQPRAPLCFQVLHVIAMVMEKPGRWRKDRQKMGMSMAAMRPRHSPTQPVSGLLPSLRGGQGLGKDDKGSLDKLESATGMGMGPKYIAPKGPREQGSETRPPSLQDSEELSLWMSVGTQVLPKFVKDLILHLGDHDRSQDSFSREGLKRGSREKLWQGWHHTSAKAGGRKEPSRTALIGITQEYLHEDSMCHDIMTACYPTHRLLSLGPMGP